MTRRYGRLPADIKDRLHDWVDILRREGVSRPYDVLGEMLGVTAHRIQQVVLEQRKEQRRQWLELDLDQTNDVFDEED